MSSSTPRVVVTGMGALTPIGSTVESFWEGLAQGRSGAAPITRFDASNLSTRFACELKGFDPLDHIDRKQAQRLDPFSQYALVASEQAFADAGLDPTSLPRARRARMGVLFGTGIGGLDTFQKQTERYLETGRVSPFFITMMIPNMASGHLSIRFGLNGPSYSVVSACATGNHNIGDGYMLIRQGVIDLALCGGSEAGVTPIGLAGFSSMKALSTNNDDPARASRPFDATRDGFVLGEGAGALILESLDHARARGATIYAELIGYGMSSDAYHVTAPDPEGICLAIDAALNSAGLIPADVDYINAHSTSTPMGDVAETEAIKASFGADAYRVNISSTKSMTGHLLGAAGAIEAIASILAIRNNRIPPTINYEHPDPACDLNYTPNQAQNRPVDVAMSNAFGFGGHNTSVVFRRWDDDADT